MPYNESDTRSKLIDPALYERGWTEENIKREVNAGTVNLINGTPRRGSKKIDYLLRFRVNSATQPVAMAIVEAKAEHLPPDHGLDQARGYAETKRFHVPFVFSSNGHQFVMYDRQTQTTSQPMPLSSFPTPDELRLRYETHVGFALTDSAARPLLTPYTGGEATRRYYQDAAIRAVFEKIARCTTRHELPRALLSLATGSGKTFIAVNLLKRIADSGQPLRALFICDREELRSQASGAFQNLFGADAAVVSTKEPQLNARVLIATYQTMDIADEEGTANFLTTTYPKNFFTHIVIDECHRSAWGKWSQVLTRNPAAVQIGLTATPRRFRTDTSAEAEADLAITADNIRHFGEPVYEYEIGQGIEDGYLAACEIHQSHINIDGQGITLNHLRAHHPVDALTGKAVDAEQLRALYERTDFEARLQLPDRVQAMCADLFQQLCDTGGPEQKTIIFCVRDSHAQAVADMIGNLYAQWCTDNETEPVQHYAFKCTAASDGNADLADLRESNQSHFIATTVDLLTTGVDVPALQNVVFFRYVRSPIVFYQMVGRGTRIDLPSGKLMFRVYDYTNATRLFGEDFYTRRPSTNRGGIGEQQEEYDPFAEDDDDRVRMIRAQGFDVQVTPAGILLLTTIDGQAMPVTVEVYRQMLSERLTAEARTLDDFRAIWINAAQRQALLHALPDGERSAQAIRSMSHLEDCDLYDVLAELAYGAAPRTREERSDAFASRNSAWLSGMKPAAAATIQTLVKMFARDGVEELERREIFETPAVKRAGGLQALRSVDTPGKVLEETKRRIFAA